MSEIKKSIKRRNGRKFLRLMYIKSGKLRQGVQRLGDKLKKELDERET